MSRTQYIYSAQYCISAVPAAHLYGTEHAESTDTHGNVHDRIVPLLEHAPGMCMSNFTLAGTCPGNVPVLLCPCWDMRWKHARLIVPLLGHALEWCTSNCALAGTCTGKGHLYRAQHPSCKGLLWAEHAHATTRQAEWWFPGRYREEQMRIRCVRQCTSETRLQVPNISCHQALLYTLRVVADGQVDGAVVAGALAQLPPPRALLPLVLRSRCQHLDHPCHRTAWPCQVISLTLA